MSKEQLFIVREAARADVPQLNQLFVSAGLTKSGPPDQFSPRTLENWCDRDVSYPLVVCLAANPDWVVAAAQLHSLGTKSRDRASLEDVAVHPQFEGRGLAKMLLGRLFWYAEYEWRVGKIVWISEDLPGRARARHFYLETIGASLADGTNCLFYLKLPWAVPQGMQEHFVPLVR